MNNDRNAVVYDLDALKQIATLKELELSVYSPGPGKVGQAYLNKVEKEFSKLKSHRNLEKLVLFFGFASLFSSDPQMLHAKLIIKALKQALANLLCPHQNDEGQTISLDLEIHGL